MILTFAIPLVVTGDPGQLVVKHAAEGGPEVVQRPGDDHVVVEADPHADEEHGEADTCGREERRT